MEKKTKLDIIKEGYEAARDNKPEKKYPIGEARIYFVFKHPKTGEEMSSKMYTPLELLDTDLSIINERTCVCDCKPVGETNVVECNCEDYYQDFEFQSYHVELAHTPVNVEQATPQGIGWVKADIKPEHNVGVLVFIPGEDNHITSGMWDIDNEWVLLDEYRTPEEEVTHWMELPGLPEGIESNDLPDELVSELKKIARKELRIDENGEKEANP